MADVDEQIVEIYESLDDSVKRSKSVSDFVPEFKGKVESALKKSGIPFTNEAFTEAISIIGSTVKENRGMTYDSIDSIVSDTFQKLSTKEIARLKKAEPRTNVDVAKGAAAIAVGAAVAKEVLDHEELHSMVPRFGQLSKEDQDKLLDRYDELSEADKDQIDIALKGEIETSEFLTAEGKAHAGRTVDLTRMADRLEQLQRKYLRIIDEVGARAYGESMIEYYDGLAKMGDPKSLESIMYKGFAKKYSAALDSEKDIKQSLEEMGRLEDRITKTIRKFLHDASQHKEVDLGALTEILDQLDVEPEDRKLIKIQSNRIYADESNIQIKSEEKLKTQMLETFDNIEYNRLTGRQNSLYDMATYIGSNKKFQKGSFEYDGLLLLKELEQLRERYRVISQQREEAAEATAQSMDGNSTVKQEKLEYGMERVISVLPRDVDTKTIEEALKLLANKTKDIAKDPKQVAILTDKKTTEAKEWLKKEQKEAEEDKNIPDDVKKVYIELLTTSLYKGKKKIFESKDSISEYLSYISQEQLPEMMKKGIEDREKSEEGPMQPQGPIEPIPNAEVNLFVNVAGGPVNGPELPTFYLGGRDRYVNEEKEKPNKLNSMENYIGKIVEGGPVTYDDIKDQFEKRDILHDLETAEPLEYNEPPIEAVNELLVGPRGKKLVKNPEEMIQEEVNPMEEVTPNEPDISNEEEVPKGPATINEPETQRVEDAKNPEEIIQEEVNPMEEVAPNEPDISNEGEAPKGQEEGISAPEEPAEINEPETQGVEDAFETAPSENGDIGIDETIPEVEEPAEEVMQKEITQEDIGEMVQEVGETPEEPQFEEADMVEEAPVPAVISDRQGQLKKISENVPMRAVREMMDHIKQKMIELKDKITGKNKNPEDRENNDDDFTQ